MKALDVHLHDGRAGRLEQVSHGKLEFSYSPEWVDRSGPAISNSLPVRAETFDDDSTRPFFAGLLPEGDFLRRVARLYGVSADNPFSLLDAIGGECAGAISITGEGKGLPELKPPALLDSREMTDLILELPTRPLTFDVGREHEALRLSLAGAQEKLPMLFTGGKFGITRGVPPSTHIIKLPMPELDGMVANEAFCMKLASTVRLNASEVQPWYLGFTSLGEEPGPEFLLVRRYDRVDGQDGTKRLHQEDFCQSLGIPPQLKYQSEGGPDPATCSRLIRTVSAAPAIDVLAFADSLVFNLVIGNRDAHGKNFSFLLEGTATPRMAPLYDLMSTSAYPNLPTKMAMKFGGEYRPEWIRGRHLDRLAEDLELSRRMFRARARDLARQIAASAPELVDEFDPYFGEQPVIQRILAQIERGSRQIIEAAEEPE